MKVIVPNVNADAGVCDIWLMVEEGEEFKFLLVEIKSVTIASEVESFDVRWVTLENLEIKFSVYSEDIKEWFLELNFVISGSVILDIILLIS